MIVAAKPLVRVLTSSFTVEYTQEKNPLSARCAPDVSVRIQAVSNAGEATLLRNPTHVLNAAEALVGALISLTIREYTLGKNRKNNTRGKLLGMTLLYTEYVYSHWLIKSRQAGCQTGS